MRFKYLILALLLSYSYVSYSQHFKGIPEGSEDVEIQNFKFEMEVLDLVNEIRIKHGFEILVWHKYLARAARYHAQDMANDDYMEHQTYDRNKNQLFKVCETFERIQKFIKISYLAENISAGKTNAKETVDAWMESKSHKENILNPNFKYMGVGYSYNNHSKYIHYWVQDFGG